MTREEQRARKAQQERMRQVERRHKEAARGQMDLPFLILTLLLTVIGLIMLFSASFPRAYYDTGDGTYYFKRQAAFAALGLVSMFIVSKINYQRWRGAGRLLVGLALFLLILVIIPHNPLAITANRATRWLGIKGVFQFQPSEIAKLAVIVYFSDTISKKREKMLTWRQGILPYVALLAVIGVLMMLEPHLSGTVLIFATGAVLMIVGGIQGWLVAVGVGGVSALAFLFVKLAEELGLIGACVIMLIFSMLILRGFWIALHARDRFGALLTVGVMTHLALQTFLNIAVVSGFVPTTGISLPFFSYGGTALCLQLVEMGIVLSVSRQIPAARAG